jgi:hypothetical protein
LIKPRFNNLAASNPDIPPPIIITSAVKLSDDRKHLFKEPTYKANKEIYNQ